MAKPRQPKHSRLDKPEEPKDGTTEGGGEGVAVGIEEEGGVIRVKKLKTTPPLCRRADQQVEVHEAREGGEETGQSEDEEGEEEGDRDGETPQGAPVEVTHLGGDTTPPEENADLPGIVPSIL